MEIKNKVNNVSEAMKEPRVYLMLILFTIFAIICSVSISSALEWDNQKSYNQETKTATIKNNFGLPLIGTTLAEITLLENGCSFINCETI